MQQQQKKFNLSFSPRNGEVILKAVAEKMEELARMFQSP